MTEVRYFVATAVNWGTIEVDWYDTEEAYRKAVGEAEKAHARDEIDTYICGDNALGHPSENFSDLWVAYYGDDGLFVEIMESEDACLARQQELREDRCVDTVDTNGPTYKPDNVEEGDEDFAQAPRI